MGDSLSYLDNLLLQPKIFLCILFSGNWRGDEVQHRLYGCIVNNCYWPRARPWPDKKKYDNQRIITELLVSFRCLEFKRTSTVKEDLEKISGTCSSLLVIPFFTNQLCSFFGPSVFLDLDALVLNARMLVFIPRYFLWLLASSQSPICHHVCL